MKKTQNNLRKILLLLFMSLFVCQLVNCQLLKKEASKILTKTEKVYTLSDITGTWVLDPTNSQKSFTDVYYASGIFQQTESSRKPYSGHFTLSNNIINDNFHGTLPTAVYKILSITNGVMKLQKNLASNTTILTFTKQIAVAKTGTIKAVKIGKSATIIQPPYHLSDIQGTWKGGGFTDVYYPSGIIQRTESSRKPYSGHFIVSNNIINDNFHGTHAPAVYKILSIINGVMKLQQNLTSGITTLTLTRQP